jgi:hypothetical protein
MYLGRNSLHTDGRTPDTGHRTPDDSLIFSSLETRYKKKQATQKRSIEYPDQLKQVGKNKKWKEFTDLKPVNYMTYEGRQYGEKDEYKLMKAIIAQNKSCNDEQKRKRQKKLKK